MVSESKASDVAAIVQYGTLQVAKDGWREEILLGIMLELKSCHHDGLLCRVTVLSDAVA